MNELLETLDAWRAQGVDAGRAVVVRTYGSAPRPEGSVMLVAEDGRIAGSVSGGCVEAAAAEEVARARRSGGPRVVRFGVTDEQAWQVGLACGGTIEVLVEPHLRHEVVEAARALGRAVVVEIRDDSLGDRLIIDEGGGVTDSGIDAAARDELIRAAWDLLEHLRSGLVEAGGRVWFVESFPRRPRLVVVGAVQVAIPLVSIARELGYETVVADAREAFATRERFPHADRLVVGWPDEIADWIGLGPSDAVVILTHDPKIDEPAIAAALARGCRYIGAIGSRRTQAERRERLEASGVAATDLDRLRGPIGLDLGGRDPAETALAIMAEIVAARHGAAGGVLTTRPEASPPVPEPA